MHALNRSKVAYCSRVDACIHLDLGSEYISRYVGAYICITVLVKLSRRSQNASACSLYIERLDVCAFLSPVVFCPDKRSPRNSCWSLMRRIDVFQGNIIIEQCACFTDRVHDWRSRNQPQKEKINAITTHFQAHRRARKSCNRARSHWQ